MGDCKVKTVSFLALIPEGVEFNETQVSNRMDGGYDPASALYFDVSFKGCNAVDGSSLSFGTRFSGNLLANPLADAISGRFELGSILKAFKGSMLYAGKGLFTAGLGVDGLYLGAGGFGVTLGGGVSAGWFSLGSGINPYYIFLAGVISLFKTSFTCETACGWQAVSDIVQSALPINTLVELFQILGVKSEASACTDISERIELDACKAYSASYRKQGRFTQAITMLENGLSSGKMDPFSQAELLTERDRAIFDRNLRGIPFGMEKLLAKNIKQHSESARSFVERYGEWIKNGGGEKPGKEAILRFMGETLYLLRKLNMSAVIDGNVVNITDSPPLAFESAEDAVRFLETISFVQNQVAVSGYLWSYLAAELNFLAEGLTDWLGEVSAESVINNWFLFTQYFSWAREMLVSPLAYQFNLRKAHFKWKIAGRPDLLGRLAACSLNETDGDALFFKKLKAEKMKPLDAFSSSFEGLGLMLRLSLQKDPLTAVMGLDFSPLGKRPAFIEAFVSAYEFLKREREGSILFMQKHIDTFLKRIVRDRKGDLQAAVEEYDQGRNEGISFCFDEAGCFEGGSYVYEILESLDSLYDPAEEEPKEAQLIRDLANEVMKKNFESTEALYHAELEEVKAFNFAIGRLERLVPEEKLEFVFSIKTGFTALLRYRGGIETARSYLGE